MTASKRMLATLIGFVVYFLLGWLFYGMILMNFMEDHSTPAGNAVMRDQESMIWWAMIVSNILIAYFITYVLGRWANISTFGGGLSAGLTMGLLMGASIDLMFYATSDMMDLTGFIVDILSVTIMWGITAGVIGWFLGRK